MRGKRKEGQSSGRGRGICHLRPAHGGEYWQAFAYAPPRADAPLARRDDPHVGTVVKVALPHPGEPFLLVHLGCGCEISHIEKSAFARRFAGLPLVFAVNDPRDLPSGLEHTDPETLREALNPWFTPRVYAFAAGGRLAYVQPLAETQRGVRHSLEEAGRAVERGR